MWRSLRFSPLENNNKRFLLNFINNFSTFNFDPEGKWVENKRKSCQHWKSLNEKMYPPQAPDEPRRPAFVCHVKEDIKYSFKKMWYVACFIRGMSIDEALKQLQFINRKGAKIAIDTLLEAQKAAVEEHNVEFKSNLWVSESFVGKSHTIKGLRRSAFAKMKPIRYGFIHYFVCLEEGSPPEFYYYHKKPKSGEELLEEWLKEMKERTVRHCL